MTATFQKTELSKNWLLAHSSAELARFGGWTFWEHPTMGDEHTILATRKGDDTVYDTLSHDIPDYL